jgi:hypothetical protein
VGNDQWGNFMDSFYNKFGESEHTAREIADWANDADLILPEEIDNLMGSSLFYVGKLNWSCPSLR